MFSTVPRTSRRAWLTVLACVASAIVPWPVDAQSLTLLGQTPQPPETVVAASSVEPPRPLDVQLRDDGMGRFEAAPGTRILSPAAGRLVIKPPANIAELITRDGRTISFISIANTAGEGPIAEGQEVGRVTELGFANVLVRPTAPRGSARPDPSKPGLIVPYGGGIAYVQVTSFTVRVRRPKPAK